MVPLSVRPPVTLTVAADTVVRSRVPPRVTLLSVLLLLVLVAVIVLPLVTLALDRVPAPRLKVPVDVRLPLLRLSVPPLRLNVPALVRPAADTVSPEPV